MVRCEQTDSDIPFLLLLLINAPFFCSSFRNFFSVFPLVFRCCLWFASRSVHFHFEALNFYFAYFITLCLFIWWFRYVPDWCERVNVFSVYVVAHYRSFLLSFSYIIATLLLLWFSLKVFVNVIALLARHDLWLVCFVNWWWFKLNKYGSMLFLIPTSHESKITTMVFMEFT